MFTVASIKDNSRNRLIGYQVVSPSKVGGLRYHDSMLGQHESSLERARIEMQKRADQLNEEANRNRSRAK